MTCASRKRLGILRDEDIQAELLRGDAESLVSRPDSADDADEIQRDVQAASIDLHVGKIYVPGVASGKRGSATNPIKDGIPVKPGGTVVVQTAEALNLPRDMAAFGFLPAGLAMKGVLTPTVGHVDPGFSGRLRMVVINMGTREIMLVQNQRIATVLFYRLSGPVDKDYGERRGPNRTDKVDQLTLDGLAADFANIDRRISNIVEDATKKSTWPIFLGVMGAGVVIPFAIAASVIMYQHVSFRFDPARMQSSISEIQKEISTLQKKVVKMNKKGISK